jgi:hypothetical protein
MKCTELENQMKERVLTISTLRDNYLRDVVAVKYHLERVLEAASSVRDSIEMNGEEKSKMYSILDDHAAELSSLPNANLRNIIESAKQVTNPTSAFMKNTLLKAGAIIRR